MKTVIWIILALVIIGGGYYWYTNRSLEPEAPGTVSTENESQPPVLEQATSTATSSATTSVDANITIGGKTVTVTYSDTGFSPKSVTVKRGDTVTFVNSGTGSMWVASAAHPTHIVYSGTSRTEHCPDTAKTAFDQCANGKEYSFTFNKVGTWKYHNHSLATDTGTIIVTN